MLCLPVGGNMSHLAHRSKIKSTMPLHPQAQAFLDEIAQKNPPPWEELPPQQGREIFNGFSDLTGEGPSLLLTEDRTLPGGVKVRIYADTHEDNQSAVIYFHGGGWVLGNIETHDPMCRRIAKSSGCTVISVDYALAPENPFPIPLEDCYTATVHVAVHAAEFRIDAKHIAVAGDSAGGNLAAAVAIKARDEAGPQIKFQLLIYPVIQPNFDSESYVQFAEGHGLTRGSMQWFWRQYIGDRALTALASPARADSLRGLPPAHVITAEYDVLRDEGEAYARQLLAAGVPTTCRRYDGNLHGFIHFAGRFDDGIKASHDISQILKSNLL